MKPRRLYRARYAVSHLVLRQAEAWARTLPSGVLDAETVLRDARGHRFRVCLVRDFPTSALLWVIDCRTQFCTERRWWFALPSPDAPGGPEYDLAHRRALAGWVTWTAQGNRYPLSLEPAL